MMKCTRYKFLLALAATIGAGAGISFAADAPVRTPAVKTVPKPPGAPLVLTGKIVVVDKVAGSVTLDVDGRLMTLVLGPEVKMVNNGKFVTLNQLATGQEVSILTRKNPDGTLNVVALSVNPSSAGAVAAGNDKAGSNRRGPRPLPAAAPFDTIANPANNVGPIISPSN